MLKKYIFKIFEETMPTTNKQRISTEKWKKEANGNSRA